MIELLPLYSKANFGLSEALPVGQLSEGHAQILIQAAERFDLVISAVGPHTAAKNLHRKVFHYLGEDKLSYVHDSPPKYR